MMNLVLIASVIMKGILSMPSTFPIDIDNVYDHDEKLTEYQKQNLGLSYGGSDDNRQRRSASGSAITKWSSNFIPFTITTGVSKLYDYRRRILEALKEIEKNTCIRFVEDFEGKNKDVMKFVNDDGCWSYIGMVGGEQELSIHEPGCLEKGTILHEVMHTTGFLHEHQRPDREKTVEVRWQNIKEGYEDEFQMASDLDQDSISDPYDPLSVMHYTKYAFSKNYQPTMVLRNNPTAPIGGDELTRHDINELNQMYCVGVETPKFEELTEEMVTGRVLVSDGCYDTLFICDMANNKDSHLCQYENFRKSCAKSCESCNTSPTIVSTTTSTIAAITTNNPTSKTTTIPTTTTTTTNPTTTTTTKPITTTTLKITESVCKDLKTECRWIWDKKTACPNLYYRTNCAKTCGYCGEQDPVSSPCKDNDRNLCDDVVKPNQNLYCKFSIYKILHCRKTCGTCS